MAFNFPTNYFLTIYKKEALTLFLKEDINYSQILKRDLIMITKEKICSLHKKLDTSQEFQAFNKYKQCNFT